MTPNPHLLPIKAASYQPLLDPVQKRIYTAGVNFTERGGEIVLKGGNFH